MLDERLGRILSIYHKTLTWCLSVHIHLGASIYLLSIYHVPGTGDSGSYLEPHGPFPHQAHIPAGDMQTWDMFRTRFHVHMAQACATGGGL